MKPLLTYWFAILACILLLTACAPPQAETDTAMEAPSEAAADMKSDAEAAPSETVPEPEDPEAFVPPKLDQPTENPLEFPDPTECSTLAAGNWGTCMIVAPNGDLVGWGINERAEFPGFYTALSFEERRVFLQNIRQVYKSFSISAALDRAGNLLVWSSSQSLGQGHAYAQATDHPEVFLAMDQVRMADIGMYYAAVIREDGSFWVWGTNMFGQLGDGTLTDCPQPRKMLDNAAFVYCDDFNTFVVTEDHALYAAGAMAGPTLRRIATGVVEVNTLSDGGFSVLTTDGRVYQCRSARTGPEDTNDVILYNLCAENAQRLLPGGYVDTDGAFWFLSSGQPPTRVLENVVAKSGYTEETFLCLTADGMLRELEYETLEEVWNWPLAEIVPE